MRECLATEPSVTGYDELIDHYHATEHLYAAANAIDDDTQVTMDRWKAMLAEREAIDEIHAEVIRELGQGYRPEAPCRRARPRSPFQLPVTSAGPFPIHEAGICQSSHRELSGTLQRVRPAAFTSSAAPTRGSRETRSAGPCVSVDVVRCDRTGFQLEEQVRQLQRRL